MAEQINKMIHKKNRKKKGKINKTPYILIFLIVFLISVGFFVWYFVDFSNNNEEGESDIGLSNSEDLGPKNPLTGKKAEVYINPTVVMISNIGEARPQTGLHKANIVYEIEMEGQITRFVALFYGDPPETAGPVRSARPYVMKYGLEWDANFVHVGGSDDAKSFAKNTASFHDIDGMYVTKGFFQDTTRKRPHNTYIEFEKLLEDREACGKIPNILFREDYGDAAECRTIKLDYGKSNRVEYVWDDEKRAYARSINDKPHADRETGEQIYANNVIIQYAKHTFSGDELGHIDVHVVGSGKAEYYIGGKYSTGTWSKSGDREFTMYYDEDGNEITRVPGNTFVQVVRDNKKMIGNIDAEQPPQ